MKNFTHVIAHKLSQDENQEFNPYGLSESGSFVYLHGTLELMNGYDIVSFVAGNRPISDGVYDVKVYLDKTTIVYCTMYYWTTTLHPTGLIVMNGDDVNMDYARGKYEDKSHSI